MCRESSYGSDIEYPNALPGNRANIEQAGHTAHNYTQFERKTRKISTQTMENFNSIFGIFHLEVILKKLDIRHTYGSDIEKSGNTTRAYIEEAGHTAHKWRWYWTSWTHYTQISGCWLPQLLTWRRLREYNHAVCVVVLTQTANEKAPAYQSALCRAVSQPNLVKGLTGTDSQAL